jgi:hypothetical protein
MPRNDEPTHPRGPFGDLAPREDDRRWHTRPGVVQGGSRRLDRATAKRPRGHLPESALAAVLRLIQDNRVLLILTRQLGQAGRRRPKQAGLANQGWLATRSAATAIPRWQSPVAADGGDAGSSSHGHCRPRAK